MRRLFVRFIRNILLKHRAPSPFISRSRSIITLRVATVRPRRKSKMRNRLWPLSCLVVFSLAGCGTSGSEPSASDDPFKSVEEQLTPLGTQCTFVAATGLMTVSIAAGETAIISKRASDSAVLQNGQSCDNLALSGTLKKIAITGANSAAKTLILDFTNGLFATGTSSASTTGITVDLGTSTGDLLGIRGTTGADNFAYGANGINLNNDGFKDITIANVESHIVYLGDGADTFTAAGGGILGGVFGTALTVYGGAGNDLFNEGAAATTSETIFGGADTDTVSYTARAAAVTVTVGAQTLGVNDDGAVGELDDIKSDVEIVTGGLGDDTLTAAPGVAVTFNGGPGNDTLIGDSGNDTLNGEAGNDTLRGAAGNDTLNGGDGDDTFDEETGSNGSDVFNGGAGIDTVDYSARSAGVVVTMDGLAANDGATGENDNVKADVENLLGSAFVDTITGNALGNVITGNAGDDVLSGLGGDDTFAQGLVSDGADTISGGTGVDTVDYSQRTHALTVTLDGVTASGESGESDIIALDVENCYGGSAADVITGNASNNELDGNGGIDHLNGLAGDDVLEGGGQADVLDCGTGDGDIGLGTTIATTGCEF
jgi:Ca2+-binding RTX toxin-like protein